MLFFLQVDNKLEKKVSRMLVGNYDSVTTASLLPFSFGKKKLPSFVWLEGTVQQKHIIEATFTF